MLSILLFLIFFNSLDNVMGSNILAVFPTPSITSQHMFSTLIREFAKHGHEITLITANLALTKPGEIENITTIHLHNKLNTIWHKYNKIVASDETRDVVSDVTLTLHTTNSFFEELIQTVEVTQLIEEKHSYFDLLLLEASVIPLLSLSHIFKAPVILVSSTGAVFNNHKMVGVPSHPFLYPSIFQRRIYNLTTWEQLTETTTYVRLKFKMASNENKMDMILKKHFGSVFPTIHELKKRVFALFLNSNQIWAGNHPVSTNVIFLGGLHSNKTEELSEDLQSFLDNSRAGVIYVSFGSNIKPSQFPPEKLLRILNVLSLVSFDILLKWDNDRLPGAPQNIKIYKWLPQSSVLAHPNIKLFITQGGIQSTFEAIDAGVPLIGIPMYLDHWYNTEKYVNFHIGLQMDLALINEEKLIHAIHKVIEEKSYRTSIMELRALMYEKPGSSLEHAIWWAEQAIRPYGVRYLRTPSDISWTEYLELDFIFSLLLVLFVKVIVLTVLITLICRYIFRSIADIKKKMS